MSLFYEERIGEDISETHRILIAIREDPDEATLLRELEELCTLICVGGELLVRTLDTSEFIEILVKLVTNYPSGDVQVFSMRALALIADMVPCASILMLRMDVPRVLVNIANRGAVQLVHNPNFAEELLKCLELLSFEGHDVFISQGVLNSLVELIVNVGGRTQLLAVGCIVNLFASARYCEYASIEPVIPLLISAFAQQTHIALFASSSSSNPQQTATERRASVNSNDDSFAPSSESITVVTATSSQRVKSEAEQCLYKFCVCFAHLLDRVLVTPTLVEKNFGGEQGQVIISQLMLMITRGQLHALDAKKLLMHSLGVLSALYLAAPSYALRLFVKCQVIHTCLSTCMDLVAAHPEKLTSAQLFSDVVLSTAAGASMDNNNGTNGGSKNAASALPFLSQEQHIIPILEFLCLVIPAAEGQAVDQRTVTLPQYTWEWEDDFHNRVVYSEEQCISMEEEYRKQRITQQFRTHEIQLGTRVYTLSFERMRHVTSHGALSRSFFRNPIPTSFLHQQSLIPPKEECQCFRAAEQEILRFQSHREIRLRHRRRLLREWGSGNEGEDMLGEEDEDVDDDDDDDDDENEEGHGGGCCGCLFRGRNNSDGADQRRRGGRKSLGGGGGSSVWTLGDIMHNKFINGTEYGDVLREHALMNTSSILEETFFLSRDICALMLLSKRHRAQYLTPDVISIVVTVCMPCFVSLSSSLVNPLAIRHLTILLLRCVSICHSYIMEGPSSSLSGKNGLVISCGGVSPPPPSKESILPAAIKVMELLEGQVTSLQDTFCALVRASAVEVVQRMTLSNVVQRQFSTLDLILSVGTAQQEQREGFSMSQFLQNFAPIITHIPSCQAEIFVNGCCAFCLLVELLPNRIIRYLTHRSMLAPILFNVHQEIHQKISHNNAQQQPRTSPGSSSSTAAGLNSQRPQASTSPMDSGPALVVGLGGGRGGGRMLVIRDEEAPVIIGGHHEGGEDSDDGDGEGGSNNEESDEEENNSRHLQPSFKNETAEDHASCPLHLRSESQLLQLVGDVIKTLMTAMTATPQSPPGSFMGSLRSRGSVNSLDQGEQQRWGDQQNVDSPLAMTSPNTIGSSTKNFPTTMDQKNYATTSTIFAIESLVTQTWEQLLHIQEWLRSNRSNEIGSGGRKEESEIPSLLELQRQEPNAIFSLIFMLRKLRAAQQSQSNSLGGEPGLIILPSQYLPQVHNFTMYLMRHVTSYVGLAGIRHLDAFPALQRKALRAEQQQNVNPFRPVPHALQQIQERLTRPLNLRFVPLTLEGNNGGAENKNRSPSSSSPATILHGINIDGAFYECVPLPFWEEIVLLSFPFAAISSLEKAVLTQCEEKMQKTSSTTKQSAALFDPEYYLSHRTASQGVTTTTVTSSTNMTTTRPLRQLLAFQSATDHNSEEEDEDDAYLTHPTEEFHSKIGEEKEDSGNVEEDEGPPRGSVSPTLEHQNRQQVGALGQQSSNNSSVRQSIADAADVRLSYNSVGQSVRSSLQESSTNVRRVLFGGVRGEELLQRVPSEYRILLFIEGIPLRIPGNTILDALVQFSSTALTLKTIIHMSPAQQKEHLHRALSVWVSQHTIHFVVLKSTGPPPLSPSAWGCSCQLDRPELFCTPMHHYVAMKHALQGTSGTPTVPSNRDHTQQSHFLVWLEMLHLLLPILRSVRGIGAESTIGTAGPSASSSSVPGEFRKLYSSVIHDIYAQTNTFLIPSLAPMCYALHSSSVGTRSQSSSQRPTVSERGEVGKDGIEGSSPMTAIEKAENSSATGASQNNPHQHLAETSLATFALWNYPQIFPFPLRFAVFGLIISGSKSIVARAMASNVYSRDVVGINWEPNPQQPPSLSAIGHQSASWHPSSLGAALSIASSPPKKIKVKVRRNFLLEDCAEVLSHYATCPLPFDIEFVGELGSGLGPTLEFYSLVSREFKKEKYKMWAADNTEWITSTSSVVAVDSERREEQKVEDDGVPSGVEGDIKMEKRMTGCHNIATGGTASCCISMSNDEGNNDNKFVRATHLFPAYPMTSITTRKGTSLFELLGIICARCLRERRQLDLNFHPIFLKAILGEMDICCPESIDEGEGEFVDTKNKNKEGGPSLHANDNYRHLQQQQDDADALLAQAMGQVEPEIDNMLKNLAKLTAGDLKSACLTFILPGEGREQRPAENREIATGNKNKLRSNPVVQLGELIPGGSSVSVTHENLSHFSFLVRQHYVMERLKRPVQEFWRGLGHTFSPGHVRLFSTEELDFILRGPQGPVWNNAEEFSKDITCDHGYSRRSRPVQLLVEVVGRWDATTQRQFLLFISGSDCVPIGGISPKITIVKKDVEPGSAASPMSSTASPNVKTGTTPSGMEEASSTPIQQPGTFQTPSSSVFSTPQSYTMEESVNAMLPTVNTCFHYLKLPPYSSAEGLEAKLKCAISEGQGSFLLS